MRENAFEGLEECNKSECFNNHFCMTVLTFEHLLSRHLFP